MFQMKKYTEEGSDEIRYAIGKAVFELLNEKTMNEIKVIDIIDKASIGKTTFYRYFENKGAKKEALYFNLRIGFQEYKDRNPEIDNIEIIFEKYVWEIKNRLRILKREDCLDVMDKLILSIFGPEDENSEDFYFRYTGAGMWMGMLRAVIAKDFQNTPSEIKKSAALSLAKRNKSHREVEINI